jgi:hypothetical protein
VSNSYKISDGVQTVEAPARFSKRKTGYIRTAVCDPDSENYSCILKCHDANGEVYYVTIDCDQVRISSSDDAIRTRLETLEHRPGPGVIPMVRY